MFCETDADRFMEKFAGRELRWRISDTEIEFRATPLDVVKAEFTTEQILSCCGTASLYDFLTHLGIDEDSISIPVESGVPDITAGWCSDCFAEGIDSPWETPWLDFYHAYTEDEDGIIFVICFGHPLCYNIENCPGSTNCYGIERVDYGI